MPTYKDHETGNRIPFAGKAELLAYANRVREAGGANVLEALLPSKPGQAKACLIARALNFGCEVYPLSDSATDYKDRSQRWYLLTPDVATTRRLAKAMRARTLWLDEFGDAPVRGRKPDPDLDTLVMVLPKRIGQAARAFDNRHPEFQEFIQRVDL